MTKVAGTTGAVSRYTAFTAGSRAHFDRVRSRIPAGATRSLNSWPPHPIYLTRGAGAAVWDVDGRRYLDFLNNYTALVLGHADAAVLSAVRAAVEGGTSFSFSTGLEEELAGRLCARVPSMEMVRFTGSGTEAVMFALRLARAATGRPKVAKVEGGYHGTIDDVMVSVRPDAGTAGSAERPRPVPDMAGLSPGLADRTVVLPFNDVAGTGAILDAHAADLAAVIVEPVLGVGGMLPATDDYLALLRRRCTEGGMVLIFDEVITMRLAVGGAQALYGVRPDLTVTGKTIGGGLPIGAFGGRTELMELLTPRGGTDVYNARSGGPPLYQGGTFTGNPGSLAAGIATLDQLDDATLRVLNTAGDKLRERLAVQARQRGLPLRVTGLGSLFNLHAIDAPVIRWRDLWRIDPGLQHGLFLELLNRGFAVAPRGMACLSTAMTDGDRDAFVDAVLGALSTVTAERT
jgi:glutamate-1-semialdehyde 2,1-aminomutase